MIRNVELLHNSKLKVYFKVHLFVSQKKGCRGFKEYWIFQDFKCIHKPLFCFRGDQWLSYDNERSIQAKTEYAWDQGLAGVMTWSIDTDDFLGMCNGPKFPLLR